ncbi:MAG: hypothetical protein B6U86_00350 [Candidatus Altiarchaeales archaeon ex4484_43]|nr:MAG: hypothetical protein B6U86_00350 [Candidatus Altiarchaeales archaeon ex4484_43]
MINKLKNFNNTIMMVMKMLYDTQQKTLFRTKNPKQEYIELINKQYYLPDAIKILDNYPARFIPQIPLIYAARAK